MTTDMRSNRRPVGPRGLHPGMLVVAIVAGVALGGSSPASAQVPFPPGAEATALVGGAPPVQSTCPPGSPGDADTGGSSTGTATVSGAGTTCSTTTAAAEGQYTLAGGVTTPLRFTANCQNTTGQTSGGVDVPAGTAVAGLGTVGATTTVATPNTAVTFPGGTTATLNQVTSAPTSVIRNAIVVGGTVVGRVVCGASVYPLPVDVAASSGARVAGAVGAASGLARTGSELGATTVAAAVLIVLGVVAQLAVGRRMWLRRKNQTAW